MMLALVVGTDIVGGGVVSLGTLLALSPCFFFLAVKTSKMLCENASSSS